jgi:hypothetical protein
MRQMLLHARLALGDLDGTLTKPQLNMLKIALRSFLLEVFNQLDQENQRQRDTAQCQHCGYDQESPIVSRPASGHRNVITQKLIVALIGL